MTTKVITKFFNISHNENHWRNQGLEVAWAQGVGGRKSAAGYRGRAPVGSRGKTSRFQKPDIHTQSAADKRIFQAI